MTSGVLVLQGRLLVLARRLVMVTALDATDADPGEAMPARVVDDPDVQHRRRLEHGAAAVALATWAGDTGEAAVLVDAQLVFVVVPSRPPRRTR